ncbi:MAG: HAD-IIB family hydrolase [Gemmatimonadaceae bacterium]|jgi:mannosyl-3-phosphoglycerate phosphatase family protein|nr:HAD-IIB family hydrolase [Gemmatimonadaceae bacterium]
MPVPSRALPPSTAAIVISDVDGTLLDDRGWAARPEELRRLLGARPLVLASSRTVRELVVLQRTLGITGPVIAENGAVIALDSPSTDGSTRPRRIGRRTVHVRRLGESTAVVRTLLDQAAVDADVRLCTADQVDPARRARRGIVGHGAHARAIGAREASVLLEPVDVAGATARRWHEALAARGLVLSSGGNWTCAVSGADKGRATHVVRGVLADGLSTPVTTVGLGNDANDAPLLAAVDRPIAVRRPDGRVHPSLLAVAHVMVCQRPGIGGAVDALRAQFGLEVAA